MKTGSKTKPVGSKRHLKHTAGAGEQYDEERIVQPNREPRSPLVGPPRRLKKGDRLAIASGDSWTPRTFDYFDEAGRMHVDVVDPTGRLAGGAECYWVPSYGDETGRNADLGIHFYRLASDDGIVFHRRCPACRGYGRVELETVRAHPLFENRTTKESREIDCELCDGRGRIVVEDPWTAEYPYVKAWNAGKGAAPSAIEKGHVVPPGHVVVGVTGNGPGQYSFVTMHIDEVERRRAARVAAAAEPVAMTEEFG